MKIKMSRYRPSPPLDLPNNPTLLRVRFGDSTNSNEPSPVLTNP
jgi:hypothetical protein